MAGRLSLSTLLSQVLVAYTIEFDNEFEQRAPHITTVGGHGGRGEWPGPWLVSQVMWTNFIRYIADDGTPVRDLQAMACLSEPAIKSRLHHLEWWRYLTFEPDPSDPRAKPRYRDLLVRLTKGGRRSRDEWKPLTSLIDKRWRSRIGKETIDSLKASLGTIALGVAEDLPDYLPVVDYQDGMRAKLLLPNEPPPQKRTSMAQLDLSALLSRVLLGLTLEFERESKISLTISANVLRVIEEGGTSLKDLPMRAGVAKEGVTVAVNYLKKNGFVTVGTDKAKLVLLTTKGKKALEEYRENLKRIEKEWEKAFAIKTMRTLRDSLEALDNATKDGKSRLAQGIEPPAGSWRTVKPYAELTEAFMREPRSALPHHPMVLHRGGFPDGS
jgi:DNA-binding MarR family transcriptional regulator